VAAPLKVSMSANSDDKVNILLVDDQPARLLSYESILSELDLNLVTARSGTEALQKLMAHEFAVVLLDVNMPDMDGFETASMIHEHPRYEKVPIIFVTGVHIGELDRLQGYKLGAVDYVSIPVVPEILRSKVAVLVELYCQRRELRKLNRSLEEANARLAQANSNLQVEKNRELEQLNSTLREANRHKDEFLAMLAHELRNPLAPIESAVQILRLKGSHDQEVQWARDVIERQVQQMTRLVNDLLDVSRITSGKINLQMGPVELKQIVDAATEISRPVIESHHHSFTVSTEQKSIWLTGDSPRLVQALSNILNNAAKYTPSGGRIALTAGQEGNDVVIRVRDSGIGIPAAMLPSIFDLFTQVNRSLDRSEGGLGIGLTLVRKIMDMHGGSVHALSAGSDLGSEFVLRLPATTPPGRKSAIPGLGPLDHSTTVTRKILVVDDNVDSARSLAMLLNMLGSPTATAFSGREALQKIVNDPPDLVFLDIGLPEMSGYEVARRLRENERLNACHLVALSGYGQETDIQESAQAGFDHHLVKPVTLENLLALLNRLPLGRIQKS
jgi:signal transduction histidine kinase